MEQNRWRRMITVAVIANLVVALGAIGLGVAALRQQPGTTTGGGGPVTSMVVPSTGATLSGVQGLAAKPIGPGVVAVDFVATGGAVHGAKIASGASSYVGWLATWDTRRVANGSYSLVSVSYDAQGRSSTSPSVVVTVRN
jgi:hypothetical protein